MNVKRVLILSATALAAAGGGYALLGLRAPSAPAAAPAAQATTPAALGAGAQGMIVVVGPDGTTYLVQAPDTLSADPFAAREGREHEREEGGREREAWD